ncbi:MAG TPA: winged helix-turn-helix domain-containing protein [Aridibacter sp.]|nr:winged helix-turn-helix domain-containing protein [Aridibacter sp.]
MVLYRDDRIVSLRPKAIETLAVLVSNAGQVVSKEVLIEKVWPETFIEENALSRNIHEIRKKLSEIEPGEYIETVTRRGYRFVAEFDKRESDRSDTSPSLPIPYKRPVRWHFVGIVLLGVFLLSSFTLWIGLNGYGEGSGISRNKRNIRTIAILPLKPLDKDEESAVISLGISDELAARMAGLDQFAVRPFSAVKRYENNERDPLEIGRELGVDAVLGGTFRREGNRFRVNLRLWDVRDGAQLWSEGFDVVESDIFRLQDQIALKVANDLLRDLQDSETAGLSERPTENAEAYRLYLRGRFAWNKRTEASLLESVRYFNEAIELDPAFALAYAGLANSYVIFNDYGVAPPEESYPKAKAASKRALEIRPDMAEARTALSYVLATYDWDFPAADSEYRKAIAADPEYATAQQWYGEMLLTLGRFKEASERLEKAKEIDPLVPIIRSELAVVKYYEGKYAESIAEFKKLKVEFPDFPTSYLFLARNYEQLGRHNEAVAEELEYWRRQGFSEERLASLRAAFDSGGLDSYLAALARLQEKDSRQQYVYDYRLVHVFGRMKDRERTLKWLRKGVENRSANIYKVLIDPVFGFLRDDPDFKVLLKEMNLPVK